LEPADLSTISAIVQSRVRAPSELRAAPRRVDSAISFNDVFDFVKANFTYGEGSLTYGVKRTTTGTPFSTGE